MRRECIFGFEEVWRCLKLLWSEVVLIETQSVIISRSHTGGLLQVGLASHEFQLEAWLQPTVASTQKAPASMA